MKVQKVCIVRHHDHTIMLLWTKFMIKQNLNQSSYTSRFFGCILSHRLVQLLSIFAEHNILRSIRKTYCFIKTMLINFNLIYNDYHTPFASDKEWNLILLSWFSIDTVVTLVIETYLKDIKKKKGNWRVLFRTIV